VTTHNTYKIQISTPSSGIGTRNPIQLVAVDPRLRQRGHRDRLWWNANLIKLMLSIAVESNGLFVIAEQFQTFSAQTVAVWTQPLSGYYITERSCNQNFSPDDDKCIPTYYLAFHPRHLPGICLRRIPSRFWKGHDRWGRTSHRSIIRSPSLFPFRKQTSGMEAYRVENCVLSAHIMSAGPLIHGSICTSFFCSLVIFQCFVAAELDNLCVFRFLETLYNWERSCRRQLFAV
jgi:hypothetical protein